MERREASLILHPNQGVRVDFISGTSRVSSDDPPRQRMTFAPMDDSAFFDILKNKSTGNDPRRIIVVFVHGFDSTFEEAMASTARLAVSMQLPVIPIAYSWASAGSVMQYSHEEDTARVSALLFRPFIERLVATQSTPVVIVAHSMGARIVTSALAELGRKNCSCDALTKVVLAAPDLNVTELQTQWSSLRNLKNAKLAFYASSNDLALTLSHIVHGYQRVGDIKPSLSIERPGDTIDASSTATKFQSWGHSYITDSPAVAADIGAWISSGFSPSKRGLIGKTQNQDTYYRFP